MANKTRNQNNVVGDTIALKIYTQNSNNFSDVFAIDHIDIVQEKCEDKTCADPEGNRLIETISADDVVRDETGQYHIDLVTSSPTYTIGKYHDIWHVQFREGDEIALIEQDFSIYPDLWITSPTPVVYSFDFRFTPNRIRQGSIKYLIIQIIPNVPRQTDLERYYHNLAISAELEINIEQNCGPCLPQERDLRLIVEDCPVTERDKVFAYYKLDTTDMDCGIYNVWFKLSYAGSVEISAKSQLQIF